MSGYVLDTNRASGILKRNSELLSKAAEHQSMLSVTMTSIAELWFMVHNSAKVEKNAGDLKVFLKSVVRRSFMEEAATEFGRIKAELRRKGRPIPDTDIQIAAVAHVDDLAVLTADAHFTYIPDLRIENWLA